jgi:toxin ParE1/3/4
MGSGANSVLQTVEMSGYRLTPAAGQDLEAIVEFIAQDSIDAAIQVLSKLESTFELLAANPRAGHYRSDLASQPIRFFAVFSYLIVYMERQDAIQILRVLGSAQDLADILH